MSYEVKIEPAQTCRYVTPYQMNSGQIGVIIKLWERPDYIGRTVIKHGRCMTVLENGMVFDKLEDFANEYNSQVEILPPGTKVTITVKR